MGSIRQRRYTKTFEARFWEKVQVTTADKCWLWAATQTAQGYGLIWRGNRPHLAHRVSYMLTHNCDLPSDVVVRHLCHNPQCCNPAHLTKGTQKDNAHDMVVAGRNKRKLRPDDVLQIRELLHRGEVQSEIAKRFNVVPSVISDINNRRIWSWL